MKKSKWRTVSSEQEVAGPLLPIRRYSPPATRNRLLQPLRGFLDDAEIGVRLDVDARLDEAELLHGVDVALQGRKVGQHVGIAEIVLLGEDPAEPLDRLLGDARADLHHGLMVGRVEI